MKILIGVPVTERGVRRLSRSLPELARRYGSIALPLPQSLCMRVVTSSVEAMDYALKLMNPSNFRVWSSLLLALKELVLSNPDVDVGCYAPEDTYATSEARGYAIATLTVKARAFGIVKPEEWLKVYKGQPTKAVIERVAGYNAIVADGYSWVVRLRKEVKPRKVLVVDTMAPTPLDVLELMALGYLDTSMARDVVDYAIKYIEYIVTSFTLTQAYNRLLEDNGYLELLRRLKLKIFKVRRVVEEVGSPTTSDPF